MSSDTESRGPGLGAKVLAILVLVFIGWIVIKLIVGIIAGVFWAILAVLAVLAVVWAWRTLF
jgi:hypothetical protein